MTKYSIHPKFYENAISSFFKLAHCQTVEQQLDIYYKFVHIYMYLYVS